MENIELQVGREYSLVTALTGKPKKIHFVGQDHIDENSYHFSSYGRDDRLRLVTLQKDQVRGVENERVFLSLFAIATFSIGPNDLLYQNCLKALGGKR